MLTVPASFDEEARELTVAGRARSRHRNSDAARRARRSVLFLDRERSGSIAEESVRWADRSRVRRRRRHQRFHADSRRPRRRSYRFHAHRSRQASAAWRRQSGSDSGVAGGSQARQIAFDPPAQRPAPPVRLCQRTTALRSESRKASKSPCSAADRHWWAALCARKSSAKKFWSSLSTAFFRCASSPTVPKKKKKACSASSACLTSPTLPSLVTWRPFSLRAGDVKPDAILFNGGFFIPEILRQRVAEVMEHWYGRRPVIFENRDLDLAVAVGARLLFLRPFDWRWSPGPRRPASRVLSSASPASGDATPHPLPGPARRRGRFDRRARSRQFAARHQ